MHITYLFPSRSRPDKFFACLKNIRDFSVSENYEIIAVLDTDDTTMYNSGILLRGMSLANNIHCCYGTSTGKIHACNREVARIKSDTDIVCLHSDDFIFNKIGFDNDIREAFTNEFKGLAHFPDGRVEHRPQKKHAVEFHSWIDKSKWRPDPNGKFNNGIEGYYKTTAELYDLYELELNQKLVTYPVMHKSYLDRFGYIYHPDYKSVMCDQEMTEVAKILWQYRYIGKKIMEHQHYRWGFGEADELMKHNDSQEMYDNDRLIFEQRQAINFGITV